MPAAARSRLVCINMGNQRISILKKSVNFCVKNRLKKQ